jgi:hypothetical protein
MAGTTFYDQTVVSQMHAACAQLVELHSTKPNTTNEKHSLMKPIVISWNIQAGKPFTLGVKKILLKFVSLHMTPLYSATAKVCAAYHLPLSLDHMHLRTDNTKSNSKCQK